MALSAKERLANERAKEAKFNSGAPGYDKGSYQLPPDYSQLIKQAQAEEAASRSSSAGAKSNGSDPWKGMRSASGATGNVPRQSAEPSGRVPTPSSASGSPSGEVPAPTSRPAPAGEGGDETSSMNTVMAIVGAALGAAGARALYKRITRGDPDAIAEAKTIVEDSKAKVAGDTNSPVARVLDQPGETGMTERMETPDIQDAEYEDITPDEVTQQKQITNQKMLPAPEMAPEDPATQKMLTRGALDESIDAQMAESPEMQQALEARPYTPPGDMPTSNAVGNARAGLVEDPLDVDAIIRNEIERGGRATRIPKIKPKL